MLFKKLLQYEDKRAAAVSYAAPAAAEAAPVAADAAAEAAAEAAPVAADAAAETAPAAAHAAAGAPPVAADAAAGAAGAAVAGAAKAAAEAAAATAPECKCIYLAGSSSCGVQTPEDILKLLHIIDAQQLAAVRQLKEAAAEAAAATTTAATAAAAATAATMVATAAVPVATPAAATPAPAAAAPAAAAAAATAAPAAAAAAAAASAAVAHARAAVARVRRLGDLRAHVQRTAARLQRLQQQQQQQQQEQPLAADSTPRRESSNSMPAAAAAAPYCPLPPPVAAQLQAAADCMQTAAKALPLHHLLLLCCDFAQLRCCSPSLGSAALQRLLLLLQQQQQPQEPAGIRAQEAALGLQLAALLLQQSVAEGAAAAAAGVQQQQQQQQVLSGVCRDRQQLAAATDVLSADVSSSIFASFDELNNSLERKRGASTAVAAGAAAAAAPEPAPAAAAGAAAARVEGPLLRLSLSVSVQLLQLLACNKTLIRNLSLLSCVRTAQACVLLSTQEGISSSCMPLQQQQPAPEVFAAAASLQPFALRAAAPYAPVAAAAVVDPACKNEALHALTCPTTSLASQPHQGVRGPPCGAPTASGRTQQLHATANFGAANRLAAAALLRRMQQLLAPRVATLLLKEAAARKGPPKTQLEEQGPHKGVNSLIGAAMAAAVKAAPTHSTRKRLLLLLLRSLQQQQQQQQQQLQQHLQLQQQQLCGPDFDKEFSGVPATPRQHSRRMQKAASAAAAAAAPPAAAAAATATAAASRRGTGVQMSAASLAVICRSLAASGLSLDRGGLSFLLECIVASLSSSASLKGEWSFRGLFGSREGGGSSKGSSKDSAAAAFSAAAAAAATPLCSTAAAHAHSATGSCHADAATAAPATAASSCPAAAAAGAVAAPAAAAVSTAFAEAVAAYGSWCTVFWAAAKVLKASCVSVQPRDPLYLNLQKLLVQQLLLPLVATLAAAEPADAGQIAEGLRLLLLLDLKVAANASRSEGSWEARSCPLLLRQRLLQVEQLLQAVQAIASHFMQHHARFSKIEVLNVLRMLVQLDLLPYIDGTITLQGDEYSSKSNAASSRTAARGASLSPISVSAFLRCALGQYLKLSRDQRFSAQSATGACSEQHRLRSGCELEASSSLDSFAQGLLLTVALKYPEDMQRLPKTLTKGVLKQAGVTQLSQCRWRALP
ncbi:hypothetical protein, conserved [Eimeria acervulina]|uniref:Uncharacterized protein n=1 Tax=Eimeria acervulina TaxID=5801 RepID=U6GKD2_EIMAC|nr:hypothetical protein, conserved [Eimeria acervulina]CDI80625.1 hypothetical protein, conserved [Eimeria acervulina]